MISKEQIAHDLTMLYMRNIYGADITGFFSIHDGDGSGTISTEKFPAIDAPKYKKIGTGEKVLFGIEKKQKIQTGYAVDDLFVEMTETYSQTYSKFYQLICDNDKFRNS